MGEIADMILDGILDEETGEYIDDEYSRNGGTGYPRTMNNSFSHSQSFPNFSNEMSVVFNFLKQRGVSHDALKVNTIKQYALESELPQKKVGKICKAIRKSPEAWIQFKTWLDKK